MSHRTSGRPRHNIAYTGAVLMSQVNRLVEEAENLKVAKDRFMESLSAEGNRQAAKKLHTVREQARRKGIVLKTGTDIEREWSTTGSQRGARNVAE